MKDRIREIRKSHLKLSQKDFASRLGMSENYIWMIEKGERIPPDRTISDICRIFGVNRIWLETGAGDPFQTESRDEEIARILGGIIAGDSTAKDRLIRALARLPDEAFELVEQFVVDYARRMLENGEWPITQRE